MKFAFIVYLVLFIPLNLLAQKVKNQYFRTHSLAAFSEIQAMKFQNFTFEPMLWYFSCGLQHNLDFITSGKNYALGFNHSFAISNGLHFQRMFFFEWISNLYARIGFVDKNDEKSLVTFRSGIGPSFYRDLEISNPPRLMVSPSYFFETILDIGIPIYFRHHRTFFHHNRTKYGYQVGIVFPL